MVRLPVVFISGAYRAATPWRVQANIRAAMEEALAVWKMGAVALCPHANTAMFDGECEDSRWLAGDLELLRRCDALLTVPMWEASTGARAEVEFATANGIAVFHSHEALAEWTQKRAGGSGDPCWDYLDDESKHRLSALYGVDAKTGQRPAP